MMMMMMSDRVSKFEGSSIDGGTRRGILHFSTEFERSMRNLSLRLWAGILRMPSNRVLILGATGGIGKHVLIRLLERGCTCTVIVRSAERLPPAAKGHALLTGFDLSWII